MHAVILEDLEQYLSGHMPPASLHRFEAHLQTCAKCRAEIEEMKEAAGLFASLRDPEAEAQEPPPGFVALVMQQLPERTPVSFWSAFRDFEFGRKVVFASLLTLAVLGTVLVSQEESYAPEPPTPQAVMADGAYAPNSDQMLVTLSNYEP